MNPERTRQTHPSRARAVLLAVATTLAVAAFGPTPSVRAADTPGTNAGRVAAPVSSRETALMRIRRMVARLNEEASTPEGETAVVTRLAGQFRTDPDSLRAQRAAWGLGYGEVAMVYGFARASRKPGVTPEQVVTMRRDGKAWEAIAKDLGIKVDTVASRMKRQAGPKGGARTR